MVSYEERIARMTEAGTLTEEQADILRQSTITSATAPPPSNPALSPRKPLPFGMLITVSIMLFILAVWLLIPGSQDNSTLIQDVSTTFNQAGATGTMKQSLQTTLFFTSVVMIPVFFILLIFILTYNSLVSQEEEVLSSWAQVESNLQRRADLIPNLVKTVQTFMQHENEVMNNITEKRAGGLSEIVSALESLQHIDIPTVDKDKLSNDAFMHALASEQAKIGQHLNKLVGVIENYPTLRSSDNFMSLQAQLEGTENRINIARIVFNDAVRDYNSHIRQIPGSLIAGIAHFQRKAYFQADEDAKTTSVDFE